MSSTHSCLGMENRRRGHQDPLSPLRTALSDWATSGKPSLLQVSLPLSSPRDSDLTSNLVDHKLFSSRAQLCGRQFFYRQSWRLFQDDKQIVFIMHFFFSLHHADRFYCIRFSLEVWTCNASYAQFPQAQFCCRIRSTDLTQEGAQAVM